MKNLSKFVSSQHFICIYLPASAAHFITQKNDRIQVCTIWHSVFQSVSVDSVCLRFQSEAFFFSLHFRHSHPRDTNTEPNMWIIMYFELILSFSFTVHYSMQRYSCPFFEGNTQYTHIYIHSQYCISFRFSFLVFVVLCVLSLNQQHFQQKCKLSS